MAVKAIWIDWEHGTLTGGSDPRKDGVALGLLTQAGPLSRGSNPP